MDRREVANFLRLEEAGDRTGCQLVKCINVEFLAVDEESLESLDVILDFIEREIFTESDVLLEVVILSWERDRRLDLYVFESCAVIDDLL